MERYQLNYFIDVLLVICLIVVGITGLVLYFAFISGAPGQGRAVEFLGTSKTTWQPWHNYFGLAMTILMLSHLVLHFKWLNAMSKNLLKKRSPNK